MPWLQGANILINDSGEVKLGECRGSSGGTKKGAGGETMELGGGQKWGLRGELGVSEGAGGLREGWGSQRGTGGLRGELGDRKSTRLNSSHV